MTRLAEVKAERDAAKRDLSITEIAAMLAIRDAADHTERVDDSDGSSHYVISAYGLTRHDGGYLMIRFVCRGQKDTIRFHAFDTWRRSIAPDFAIAAERIATTQYRLLRSVA